MSINFLIDLSTDIKNMTIRLGLSYAKKLRNHLF